MFLIAPLRSGSKGNASLIETAHTRILIDCGGIASEDIWENRLRIHPETLDAILVTHCHRDHLDDDGIDLANDYGIPLYIHRSTCAAAERRLEAMEKLPTRLIHHFGERGFKIGDLRITPFRLSHQGPWNAKIGKCFGFAIKSRVGSRNYCLGYLTDAGTLSEANMEALVGCHCLVLESNHDVRMERDSDRNPRHISWILSRDGHLSNDKAAEAVRYILDNQSEPLLRDVILVHLSKDCNTQAKALRAVSKATAESRGRKPRIYCAEQYDRLRFIRIDRG